MPGLGLQREAHPRVGEVGGGDLVGGPPEPAVLEQVGVALAERSMTGDGKAVVDVQPGVEDSPAGPVRIAAVDAQDHALGACVGLLEPLDLYEDGLTVLALVRFRQRTRSDQRQAPERGRAEATRQPGWLSDGCSRVIDREVGGLPPMSAPDGPVLTRALERGGGAAYERGCRRVGDQPMPRPRGVVTCS